MIIGADQHESLQPLRIMQWEVQTGIASITPAHDRNRAQTQVVAQLLHVVGVDPVVRDTVPDSGCPMPACGGRMTCQPSATSTGTWLNQLIG